MPDDRLLATGYLNAKACILAAGYESDVRWAEDLELVRPDAVYVTRETAWVILNSGFRYAVARKLWPDISRAFLDWDPSLITSACTETALTTLNHPKKLAAMVEVARIVRDEGHQNIVREASDPLKLTRLPWIGRITCWHLAKVLGADVIKPDVHLQRAAKAAGFDTALALCKSIADFTGDRLTVIDSVLWRYGERQKVADWPSWDELWQGGTP